MSQTIAQEVTASLRAAGYSQPRCNQVALLITGLVAGEAATVSGLGRSLARDEVSLAREPSIVRRLLRLLAEPDLDPERLLPAIFRALLPRVLAGMLQAHTANAECPAAQHARFSPIRLVIDETSQEDAVHALVIGLWYQGLVLPLAVRVWPQNQPLSPEQYWTELGNMLWEVQATLPPVLREHVLLLADRGYGHARFIDALNALGWGWVVRCTGQVRVRLPDGQECQLRDLVAQPGARRTTLQEWAGGSEAEVEEEAEEVVAVFKKAGWRQSRVVGVWLPQQTEPWLLLTNRPARPERLCDYAQRWAIERLFLSWKSHGWQLESGRVRDVPRLGRLISGLVIATWWRLAAAQPVARAELARLAGRAPAGRMKQLAFPWPAAKPPDRRTWPAKFSLFTWGARAIADTDRRHATPLLDWTLTGWDDLRSWPQRCAAAAMGGST